ncbi:MAG: aminotransferase class I and II [Chryseobacterium sp.]|nr:MAG: aminotransferase class I and II [Chryseobacterium sp.]
MAKIEPLRTVTVTRYITPLREGGSLPALSEADDGFKYVLKFRGAGHGVKMLISELIGGEIARVLKLPVPEMVLAYLVEDYGRSEGDEEIQDLLKASTGLNLGLHYLSEAVNYDPAVMKVDAETASRIVWLDAFVTNIDRTFRNTNMLMWHRELWLIDHGASLYFHHSWDGWEEKAKSKFPLIKDHVLLPAASEMQSADSYAKELLNTEVFDQIVELIPIDWLQWDDTDLSPEQIREVYKSFLNIRLEHSHLFTQEAEDARARLI